MITCTRRFQWAMGHRVYRHEGKCRHLHGHNYVALVTVQAPELDELGRVVDFGELKERVGGWIEKYLDHGFAVYGQDSEALQAVLSVPEQKVLVLGINPTAENLAEFLADRAARELSSALTVTEVTVWETENCYATWRAQ